MSFNKVSTVLLYRKEANTNPGLPLSIQGAPVLLLQECVCPLKSLIFSGELTKPKLRLFTGNRL